MESLCFILFYIQYLAISSTCFFQNRNVGNLILTVIKLGIVGYKNATNKKIMNAMLHLCLSTILGKAGNCDTYLVVSVKINWIIMEYVIAYFRISVYFYPGRGIKRLRIRTLRFQSWKNSSEYLNSHK